MPTNRFAFDIAQPISLYAQRYGELSDFLAAEDVARPAEDMCWKSFWEAQQRDPQIMLGKFAAYHTTSLPADDVGDWTEATLDELISNIVGVHHAYVREQLGRMQAMVTYLIKAAPRANERLDRMQATLTYLRERWLQHMAMEEDQFFPCCLRLENARDFVDREQLDTLLRDLRQTTHDHRVIELYADRLQQAVDQARTEVGVADRPILDALEHTVHSFIADAAVHAAKEDEILLPAVMFAHEIRRSDSESGRVHVSNPSRRQS